MTARKDCKYCKGKPIYNEDGTRWYCGFCGDKPDDKEEQS